MTRLNGWGVWRMACAMVYGLLLTPAVSAQSPQYTVVELTVGNTSRSVAHDMNATGRFTNDGACPVPADGGPTAAVEASEHDREAGARDLKTHIRARNSKLQERAVRILQSELQLDQTAAAAALEAADGDVATGVVIYRAGGTREF